MLCLHAENFPAFDSLVRSDVQIGFEGKENGVQEPERADELGDRPPVEHDRPKIEQNIRDQDRQVRGRAPLDAEQVFYDKSKHRPR